MKIIKRGHLPLMLVGTCGHCGCQVECADSECQPVSGQIYGFVVKCPTAGCQLNIPMAEGVFVGCTCESVGACNGRS